MSPIGQSASEHGQWLSKVPGPALAVSWGRFAPLLLLTRSPPSASACKHPGRGCCGSRAEHSQARVCAGAHSSLQPPSAPQSQPHRAFRLLFSTVPATFLFMLLPRMGPQAFPLSQVSPHLSLWLSLQTTYSDVFLGLPNQIYSSFPTSPWRCLRCLQW